MLYSLALFIVAFVMGAVTSLVSAAALVYYFFKLLEEKYTQHVTATPNKRADEDAILKVLQESSVSDLCLFLLFPSECFVERNAKCKDSSNSKAKRNGIEQCACCSSQIPRFSGRPSLRSNCCLGALELSREICYLSFLMRRFVSPFS